MGGRPTTGSASSPASSSSNALARFYRSTSSARSPTADERSLWNWMAWFRWLTLGILLPLLIVWVLMFVGYNQNGSLDLNDLSPVDLAMASVVILASTIALAVALPKTTTALLVTICWFSLIPAGIELGLDVNTAYFSGLNRGPSNFSSFPLWEGRLTLAVLGLAIFVSLVGRLVYRTGSRK